MASPYVMEGSSLFEEYLTVLGEMPTADVGAITSDDALLVIDMQADFVPANVKTNPHGGRFGVSEAELIINPICTMMNHFAAAGATIVASRSYHPADHVSFLSQGGHLPPHCIAGSKGSHLIGPIAETMSSLLASCGPERVFVCFKGFHEDIDSFGAFPYDTDYSSTRLTQRAPGNVLKRTPCAPTGNATKEYGRAATSQCSLTSWTGCLVLKQSNVAHAYLEGEPADMNSPPDILAISDGAVADGQGAGDGARRGRKSLAAALKGKRRLFVCGLALDIGVLDTCLNARIAGFEVVLVVDAARPAHIPSLGTFGSGFLNDPKDVHAKAAKAELKYASFGQLIPSGALASLVHTFDGKTFPEELGPLGIANADLVQAVTYNEAKASYTIDLQTRPKLDALGRLGFNNRGVTGPVAPLPPDWTDAPPSAVSFCWAYPMKGIAPPSADARKKDRFLDKLAHEVSLVCLEISHSHDLRFAMYGGFFLLNKAGKIVAVQALTFDYRTYGEDLIFEPPEPFRSEYVPTLEAAGRMRPVTLPDLKRHGAVSFCWLMLGETIHDDRGYSWCPSKTGCFVFTTKSDGPLLFRRTPHAKSAPTASAATSGAAKVVLSALVMLAIAVALGELIIYLETGFVETSLSLPSQPKGKKLGIFG